MVTIWKWSQVVSSLTGRCWFESLPWWTKGCLDRPKHALLWVITPRDNLNLMVPVWLNPLRITEVVGEAHHTCNERGRERDFIINNTISLPIVSSTLERTKRRSKLDDKIRVSFVTRSWRCIHPNTYALSRPSVHNASSQTPPSPPSPFFLSPFRCSRPFSSSHKKPHAPSLWLGSVGWRTNSPHRLPSSFFTHRQCIWVQD